MEPRHVLAANFADGFDQLAVDIPALFAADRVTEYRMPHHGDGVVRHPELMEVRLVGRWEDRGDHVDVAVAHGQRSGTDTSYLFAFLPFIVFFVAAIEHPGDCSSSSLEGVFVDGVHRLIVLIRRVADLWSLPELVLDLPNVLQHYSQLVAKLTLNS